MEEAMFRRIIFCGLLCLSMFSLSAASAAEIEFKIGLGDPMNSEAGFVALRFKEIVEYKTNGKVEVQIFPSCSLGDEPEMSQNVRAGNLDMTIVGIPNVVPFVKKLGIMTMPYIFDDVYDVVRATTGPAHELLNSYAEKDGGFIILGWVYSNFRYISNSKKPIRTISDIKDMKIRVPGSAVMLETYKAWGANPVPIAWPELFTAMQQGVIDGQCYGYIYFNAAKFDEANQKYVTEIYYTPQIQPMLVSPRAMASMDPDLRDIIVGAARDAQDMGFVYQLTESDRAKEELIARGVSVVKLEDPEVWRKKAVDEVWPAMEGFVGGAEAVNEFLRTLGKKPWK